MKEIRITIPTNKKEAKEWLMRSFGWMTKPGRMKNNNEVLDELYKEIRYEICSGYWSKDISDYMKKELFTNGRIGKKFREAKDKLI